jgi:hypothetical protein
MPIKWIIFNGPDNSGKTLAANRFVLELRRQLALNDMPHNVVKDSIDAPLRHFIATMLGERYNEMDKDRAIPELAGYTIRGFMKFVSEEIGLELSEDALLRALVYRVQKTAKPDYVVIDDGGIGVEPELLKNAKVIRVDRSGTRWSWRNQLQPCWMVMPNNDTHTELYILAEHAAREYVKLVKQGL